MLVFVLVRLLLFCLFCIQTMTTNSTGCAIARARSLVDESNCLFNFFFVNPMVTSWLIKSAYGIPPDACDGWRCQIICGRCLANQIYQTALKNEHPIGTPDVGPAFNKQPIPSQWPALSYLCCAFLCPCFVTCNALRKYIKMPCGLAFCCVPTMTGEDSLFNMM